MLIPGNILQACGGPPVPPCGRAVFLAKFTPGVVVIPPAGGAINVPIGVLPFAGWNTQGLPNAPVCPQPTAATLTLTLTCFPSGTVIGPQAFAVPVPTVPGAQPLGGPVNFVIPAGVFPPGTPPQICLVVGTYSVTFSDGVVLVFNGDTEVCLVPPTVLDDTVPELEMRYLSQNDELYQTCRRGDQAISYFLIANNDPDQSVTLDLNSIGRQIGHLPEGFTTANSYANDVYSVSLPIEGTDTYAAAFTDELMPNEILPEPNPEAVDPQLLERGFTLQPCEAIIIGISMRSFGMCANGSCNERLVKVEGTFANGDPALACASTLLVVDDVPAKTVLCEFSDSIKVSPEGDAVWSYGAFGDANGPYPHSQTFYAGNLSDGGFRTAGEFISDMFPAAASDYVRMTQDAMSLSYQVNYNSPQCGPGDNIVTLLGIDNPNLDFISVPIISFQFVSAPLEIEMDFFANQILLSVQGDIVFQGPIDLFFADPPPEFCIDPEICRIIKKESNLSEKALTVIPPAVSRLFIMPGNDPGCDTLEAFNNITGESNWDGMVDGDGIMLTSSSGMGEIEFCYENLSMLNEVPATTISYLEITCPSAINNPIRVPIAIRVKAEVGIDRISSEKFLLNTCVPNPFNSNTRISYSLSESADVSLIIFNQMGQEVRSLVEDQKVGVGSYSVEWNGRNENGNLLSPGIYICQMTADGFQQTSKMVLVQ